MSDITNLQELINQRAYERAKDDVNKWCQKFREDNDFDNILSDIKITYEGNTDNLRSIFWNSKSLIPSIILERLKEIYIKGDTKEFVDKVENLSKQVEDLKNGINFED